MTQKVTNQDPTPRGLPFLFGAQYYRAPTPSADCWERTCRACASWASTP
jgi:hypothetical protein